MNTKTEETTMNHKIALSVLAIALAFVGASGAMAASKKHSGNEAYAAAGEAADPRINKGGNHESWCDVDPQCNGWNQWLALVSNGKLKH
jgi:hypothetical protein